jgi:hypothetical protein
MPEFNTPRLDREYRTIRAMIKIYCRELHNSHNGLCEECRKIEEYAKLRLINCPFGEEKPVCVKCPVHCYKPDMRQKVKEIMRYSGPKMLRHHPILAIRHLLFDSKREAPQIKKKTDLP